MAAFDVRLPCACLISEAVIEKKKNSLIQDLFIWRKPDGTVLFLSQNLIELKKKIMSVGPENVP